MIDLEIKKLSWDSAFFGYEIGKYNFKKSITIDHQLNFIKKSSFDLVQLFSNHKLDSIHNLIPIDVKYTFTKKVSETPMSISQIKSTSIDENGALFKLSLQAGKFSRFKRDKKLNTKFKEMYKIWINKSLKRELASDVFIYTNQKKIYGLVTVKKETKKAKIGLIAVDNKSQNMGIGSKLIQSIDYWAHKRNLTEINVTTQMHNEQACEFYIKNNFGLSDKTYVYHLWKNL